MSRQNSKTAGLADVGCMKHWPESVDVSVESAADVVLLLLVAAMPSLELRRRGAFDVLVRLPKKLPGSKELIGWLR